MTENTRKKCTPQEYIIKLFEETKDGKLEINFFPILDQQYSLKYDMNWLRHDAENLVKRYNDLTNALVRIGKIHRELQEENDCQRLLTAEDFEVWHTYIRPFEAFEVDPDVITELYFRREADSLDDEENELLERHHEWFVANSQQRLPSDNCCPAKMINRAQRYEKLVELGAPKIVLEEEGRSLAEEMVLYYHSIKKTEYNLHRFVVAQNGTYLKALEEIKNGKKLTHWMWYIFPQLRGLGTSDMSYNYGIVDLDEAKQYLSNIVLGRRLLEISSELLKLDESDPKVIFGAVDAIKLKSSMTLFSLISAEDSVFHKVLQKFFKGQTDSHTLELLAVY